MQREDSASDSSSYDSVYSNGEGRTVTATTTTYDRVSSGQHRESVDNESLDETSADESSAASTSHKASTRPPESHSSAPLAHRLKSVETNEEERAEIVRETRRRKKLAKEEATKRLAALRATKVNPGSQTNKPAKEAKNRPTEASSRRADFYRNRGQSLVGSGHGVDLGAHRYKPKDPRGNNLAGHFDQDQFDKNYSFVNELKQKEIDDLKNRIAARQLTGRRGQKKRRALGITTGASTLEEDKARLQDLQQQLAAHTRQQIDTAASRSVKKELRETASRVGKPVFLTRKEMKRRTDEARLQQIQEQQGRKPLEKYLAKRRKRQKSRDAKRQAKGNVASTGSQG